MKSLLSKDDEPTRNWLAASKATIASGHPVGLYISVMEANIANHRLMDAEQVERVKMHLEHHPRLGKAYLQALDAAGCFQKANLLLFHQCSFQWQLSSELGHTFDDHHTVIERDIDRINEVSDILTDSSGGQHLILDSSFSTALYFQQERSIAPLYPEHWMSSSDPSLNRLQRSGGFSETGYRFAKQLIADPIGITEPQAISASSVRTFIANSNNPVLATFYAFVSHLARERGGFQRPITVDSVFEHFYTRQQQDSIEGYGHGGLGYLLTRAFTGLNQQEFMSLAQVTEETYQEVYRQVHSIFAETRNSAQISSLLFTGLLGGMYPKPGKVILLGFMPSKMKEASAAHYKTSLLNNSQSDDFLDKAYEKYTKLPDTAYLPFDTHSKTHRAPSVHMTPVMDKDAFKAWAGKTLSTMAQAEIVRVKVSY